MSVVLEEKSFTIQPLKAVKPVIVAASEKKLVAKRVNMTHDEYNADTSAVRSTILKSLLRSPMHYMHDLTATREEKDHFRIGTDIHAYLLERDRFDKEYVIAPDKGRTKASKQAYDDFIKEHPEAKFFISESEMTMIRCIGEQVSKHTEAAELLKLGVSEQSYFWTDEETGILCKIRLDKDCAPFAILDVKSTSNASEDSFRRDVERFNYDLSAAMYQEGVYRVTGELLDVAWLAVEKEAPHGVALYNATEYLEGGHKKFRKALRLLKSCRESHNYPGYQPNGLSVTLRKSPWYK